MNRQNHFSVFSLLLGVIASSFLEVAVQAVPFNHVRQEIQRIFQETHRNLLGSDRGFRMQRMGVSEVYPIMNINDIFESYGVEDAEVLNVEMLEVYEEINHRANVLVRVDFEDLAGNRGQIVARGYVENRAIYFHEMPSMARSMDLYRDPECSRCGFIRMEAHRVEMPRMRMPSFEVPSVRVPRIAVPRIGVPSIEFPRMGVSRIDTFWNYES